MPRCLVPPGPDEFLTLAEFKRQFDDLGRKTHDAELAVAAFDWLGQVGEAQRRCPRSFFLNHPSRKVNQT